MSFYPTLGQYRYPFGESLPTTVGMLCMLKPVTLLYIVFTHTHTYAYKHAYAHNAYRLYTPTHANSSEHAFSFVAFWRRIFKRETTEQHGVKPSDHNQPQIESESKDEDVCESKDDDSSDALNSSAAEPTEPASYRSGVVL